MTALVFGIPLVLIAFHVTPPLHVDHGFFNPDNASRFLGRPLDDGIIAGLLVLAAWLTWLWLLVCVAVEVVACVRGRPARHLPASRHIQSLVATLVGASLAVIPLGTDGLPMRLSAMPTAIHIAIGHDKSASSKVEATSLGDNLVNLPAPSVDGSIASNVMVEALAVSYVVKRGDTLWSIASRELNSPLRWQEIALLNYDRLQSDGRRLTDAHWIYPGWQLLLPASNVLSRSSPAAERMSDPAHEGAPDAGEIAGSQVLSGHGVPSLGIGREQSSNSPSTVHSNLNIPNPEAISHNSSALLPLGAMGYGVLGAGVIGLLDRMRRAQRRHRKAGLRIALPDADLAELERELRTASDPEGAEAIDVGLRALVVHTRRYGTVPPKATVMRLGDRTLEMLLDQESVGRAAPPPFSSGAEGTYWSLSRDAATIRALSEDPEVRLMDAPFPALVTLGRDQTSVVFADLEQAASLDVTGGNVEALLGTFAIEMAAAKWADQVDVVLVGWNEEFGILERVNHVPTIAGALPRVQRRVRERRALLASVGRDANWEIRWAEGGDAWDLCLVIVAQTAVDADPHGAGELIRLAGSGGFGLAVVLGSGADGARWHLDSRDGHVVLKSDESTAQVMESATVDSEFPRGVSTLLAVASRLEGVSPEATPYDRLEGELEVADPEEDEQPEGELDTHAEGREPDLTDIPAVGPEIDVRVLGPIEIAGAARPFTRAWAAELVVYLAMHRKGATSDQWATALWPDKVMAAASLHSTASAARRSLGVAASGSDHLPRAHGRLTLGPSVGSDWHRFVELSDRTAPDSWRRALELIRGRPFEGLRASDWVLLEGIAAHVEAVVVDLASRFAEHCLASGDATGAEWSARQGLRVSAYDERLYRILLRAADLAGNPAGVESTMAELVRLVAEDVEPFDAVHPETLDLYRALSRRPTPFANR